MILALYLVENMMSYYDPFVRNSPVSTLYPQQKAARLAALELMQRPTDKLDKVDSSRKRVWT